MTHVAGFDIGGTHARLVVYDQQWRVKARDRRGTREVVEPRELAALMREMLDRVAEYAVDAIGVGLAGQLGADGRVIANAPNFGWTDVAFADLVADTLDTDAKTPSIRIVNDLSALLWGEFQAGAARGHLDTLAVYIGTGVGGAILTEGALVDGAGGKAGEIGHVKVAPGGRLCGCGQRGCVEAYAGGAHLERQVLDVATGLGLDGLRDDGDVDLGAAEEMLMDVPELDAIWERATDYLAVSIANAVTLLNPGALLIGGGVFENLARFSTLVLTKTTPLISASARDDLEILTPDLGDDAGVLGAAMLASRH
jgi:glucokinase